MKKIKFLFLIAAASTLLFCACAKKNNPAPFNPVVSFKFNNTAFSSTNITTGFPHDSVIINSQFAGQSAVTLNIPNAKVGSFDVATSGATFKFANGIGLQNVYTSSIGTIVVTSLTSTTVEGTFAVSADNVGGVTATITEGQFKAKLP